MNIKTYLKNPSFIKKLDSVYLMKLILYLMPVVAIIGIAGTLLLGLYNFSVLGLYLAVPMIMGPMIYYAFFQRQTKDDPNLDEDQ